MFFPTAPSRNLISNRSRSNSNATDSGIAANQWIHQFDQRLFRAIDYLHLFVMLFSLSTGLIVIILRNELFEQCPLYANLYLRVNETPFSIQTVDRNTVWGSVYTCEFASFTYLSIFVLSFISLWLHIVFRRVLRTERLLRLPVGLLTLIFTFLAIIVSSIVTDGVIKFCLYSQSQICSPSGTPIFSGPRWKIISLPVGGWLTTIAILLNTIARGIQLFSKPKKSPEALKSLINQLMANRRQEKLEKENSEYGSQISRNRSRSQPFERYSIDNRTRRDRSSEPYPHYHPPFVPEYRQIKKPSRFKRFFCPCIYRRRRYQRPLQDPYRPFVIPDEYYHRLNHLKETRQVPEHLCQQHAKHQSVEQQTQTDFIPIRNSIDEPNQTPFLGRRRSSVRFEDEVSLTKPEEKPSFSLPKTQPIPIIKEEKEKPTNPITETYTDLQRNVSFRNNEDDLWTTITINTDQNVPIQSSHYNRLTVENLSLIDTSITNSNNGVTAIHVNSTPIESIESENMEKENSSLSSPPPAPPPPPPPQSSSRSTRHRPSINRHKPPPPLPSRSHTVTSSDDENNFRHKKQSVVELNPIVPDTYNYNDLSKALKSNVERLKNTFIHAQENQSIYDKPMNIRSSSSKKSIPDHSSDC